jgi:hypothetical protein
MLIRSFLYLSTLICFAHFSNKTIAYDYTEAAAHSMEWLVDSTHDIYVVEIQKNPRAKKNTPKIYRILKTLKKKSEHGFPDRFALNQLSDHTKIGDQLILFVRVDTEEEKVIAVRGIHFRHPKGIGHFSPAVNMHGKVPPSKAAILKAVTDRIQLKRPMPIAKNVAFIDSMTHPAKSWFQYHHLFPGGFLRRLTKTDLNTPSEYFVIVVPADRSLHAEMLRQAVKPNLTMQLEAIGALLNYSGPKTRKVLQTLLKHKDKRFSKLAAKVLAILAKKK